MTALARWWFAPAPAERLAALRILIGGFALVYVLARLPELSRVARYGPAHFRPVGVARVLDAPLSVPLALAVAIATIVLLGAFVAGYRYRVTAPLAAAGLLWTITYRNAWGMVFHTENLLVLHVIALACAPAADAWAVGPRAGAERAPASAGYGWPLKLCAALTATSYLLAGIAKLRIAGLDWLDGELLRDQIAIDSLRKAVLGDGVAPLAHLVLEHPAPLLGFCAATIAVELGAPLALIHRRAGHVWAITAWGFHLGVVLVMNIWFPYPLFGFAFLPLVAAEKPVAFVTTTVVMLRRTS